LEILLHIDSKNFIPAALNYVTKPLGQLTAMLTQIQRYSLRHAGNGKSPINLRAFIHARPKAYSFLQQAKAAWAIPALPTCSALINPLEKQPWYYGGESGNMPGVAA
jgi:hypothetical protein